jgi:hypothetical protein
MLANSAASRGLPHAVIRNLNYLYSMHGHWHYGRYHSVRNTWNGQLPPNAPEYTPRRPSARMVTKNALAKVEHEWDSQAWQGMSEVIHMAEARDQVEFGQVVRRRVREVLPGGKVLL